MELAGGRKLNSDGGRIGLKEGYRPGAPMDPLDPQRKISEVMDAYDRYYKGPGKKVRKIPFAKFFQIYAKENFADGGRIGFAGGSYKDKIQNIADELAGEIYDKDYSDLTSSQQMSVYKRAIRELDDMFADKADMMRKNEADGGRIGLAKGTDEKVEMAAGIEGLPININSKGIKELDLRETGGFIPPVGVKEKADDIPAMLSNNEFVFTADSVRAAGGGSVDKGAQIMYDTMKKLESKIA